MAPIDTFLLELDEYIARVDPIVEGLRDYHRLNITDETRTAITEPLVKFEELQKLAHDARHAVRLLQNGGYPLPPHFVISRDAWADLAANERTILAAFQQFGTEGEVVTGEVRLEDKE